MISMKDLIRKRIKEMDFKSQKSFNAYNSKHKMRKTTKVNIAGKETTAGDASDDVGGPAHPNVPKGAKTSKQAKEMKKTKKSEKEVSKIEKNMMNAADSANAKMDAAEWLQDTKSIDSFNKMAADGEPVQFDTDSGQSLTWDDGEGGMFNSVIAIDQDGGEVEVSFDDIVRFDKPPTKPLSPAEELKKWKETDKKAMDKYGDYLNKEAGISDKMKKNPSAMKRLARDLMAKDYVIPGTPEYKKQGEKMAKSMGLGKKSKVKDSYEPYVISMRDLIKESIASDIESAGKRAGIQFKKITNDITTNKFSNPTGDPSKIGKDSERVRMNSWMSTDKSVNKENYKEVGEKFIKLLKSKFKLIKYEKYSSGVYAKFMKDKKNIRTEFVIQWAKSMAGPYVSYTGVYGE